MFCQCGDLIVWTSTPVFGAWFRDRCRWLPAHFDFTAAEFAQRNMRGIYQVVRIASRRDQNVL
jgi:hypothetical protein